MIAEALLDVLAAIKRCQRQTSNELACPCELSNSPCLYLTAESDSAVYFQPGRVECPYHPANTAGSNMEGYRYACNQARQTSWSQRGRERRRRDSLATYLDTPTRTVNLPGGEDDGHQHAPLLLRDAVPEPATPAIRA